MTATPRQRMLAVMGGGPVGRPVPWAPRMDLWQIARAARGDLPARFAGLDTPGLADALGVACHAVRADYTRRRPPADAALRGLGLDNHPDYPYRVELEGLQVATDVSGDRVRTVIDSGAGDVVTELESTPAMRAEGISLPFVRRYPIASPADFDAVARVFEAARVVPTPGGYRAFAERVGSRGVAVASGPVAASPMHLVLHELAPMDRFFYLYADARAELEALAARLDPFYEACLEALCASDAEVVLWGANYDRDLTWPPFFQAHIAPWLRRAADALHDAGKLLLTHADGENDGLLPCYAACGVDVVESVCPAPMTRLTLGQLRAGFGPEVTVWGGVPSVALLPDAMDEARFDSWLDELSAELADGTGLILGVSDNVPPDADLMRLTRIGERL